MNQRSDDIENAANDIIKNNKKFWLGYLFGAATVLIIVAFYFIGKLLG